MPRLAARNKITNQIEPLKKKHLELLPFDEKCTTTRHAHQSRSGRWGDGEIWQVLRSLMEMNISQERGWYLAKPIENGWSRKEELWTGNCPAAL